MTHCPNCQQALPEPPDRFCPNCGADLQAGAPGGPPPLPGDLGGTPWERRDQLGFVSALVETTQRVLASPGLFFRHLRPEGGLGGPLLYAIIVGYVGAVASALYSFIANSVMGGSLGTFSRSPQMERLMPFFQGPGVLLASILLGPVFVAVEVFVLAGLVHLGLAVLGGAKQRFEATCRTVCYAEAASLAKIVPFCGGLLALVYLIVLLSIGISEIHGISRGKAAAAVLVPLVLVCCCCGGVVGLLFFMGMSAAIGTR